MNRSSFVYGAVLALVVFCLGAISALGANVCVGPSATGNGSGSDWNNVKAWSGSPARGDTWYLADGNYTARTFSTAASGTTVITIKKAIESDHGPSTGWSSTYGDGQAVITGTMTFSTPYWIFSGTKRNEADWFDANSYGIVINTTGMSSSVLWQASYSTMQYIALNGGTLPPNGSGEVNVINWSGGSLVTAGNVSRCLVRNGCNHFFMRNCEACIVEYCASENAKSTDGSHGEIVNWYGYFGPGNNCVYRYSIARNNYDQGYSNGANGYKAATAIAAIVTASGCQIYGNVWYNNCTTDGSVGWTGTRSGYEVRNLKVYNNTIIGGWGQQGIQVENNSSGCDARNNVWVGNTPSFAAITHSYNAFSASSISGETSGQYNVPTSTFVNYAGNNYQLKSATTAGTTLASPYNKDSLGNTRGGDGTWDRGAYEYGGVLDTTPPVITSVGSSSATSTGAVIGWTTDEAADGVVEYGTTTAYGSSVANASLALAHSVTLGSLVPNTVYHYRVRSTDGAGNTSTSGDFTFTTATADTTPPTATLTAPAHGVTVSNTVSLTATASDNVGVVGVRFFVSGTQVSDDTSSPYAQNWDSTTVTNGSYRIYAQARDGAGNTNWSGTNVITVSNTAVALPIPAAYWTFDEGTGTTAADNASNNTLTLRNGATWAGTGKFGGGLLLDGVNDRADAPNSLGLDINGSAISVAAWVKLENQGAWQQIVVKVNETGVFTSPYCAWHLFGGHVSASTQWTPQFQLINAIENSVSVGSSANVNYGEWVHVVGVYDGSTVRIYVNGVDRGSAAQSGNIISYNQPLYIGAHGLPGEFAKGVIDEVRIYSGALSATQVQALYLAPAPVANRPSAPAGLRVVQN